jgi:hypothetical protein
MNSKNSPTNILTPSAQDALEDIIMETREKVISAAVQAARLKGTADKEISLSDILEAKEKVFYTGTPFKDISKKMRMLTILSLTSSLYAVFGLFFYLTKNKDFILKDDSGLIISSIGIFVALTSLIVSQLLAKQQNLSTKASNASSLTYDDFAIIKRWQTIERLSSSLMESRGISADKAKSVRTILDFMSLELQDSRKSEKLRQLLTIRNQIVHEGKELSDNDRRYYLDISTEIIDTLESLRKRPMEKY